MPTPPIPFSPGRTKRLRDKNGSLLSIQDDPKATASSPFDTKRPRFDRDEIIFGDDGNTTATATSFKQNLTEAFDKYMDLMKHNKTLKANYDEVENQLKGEQKLVVDLQKKLVQVEACHSTVILENNQYQEKVKERDGEIERLRKFNARLVLEKARGEVNSNQVIFGLDNRIKGLEKDLDVMQREIEQRKAEKTEHLQKEAKWLDEKGALLIEQGRLRGEMLKKDKEINSLKLELDNLASLSGLPFERERS